MLIPPAARSFGVGHVGYSDALNIGLFNGNAKFTSFSHEGNGGSMRTDAPLVHRTLIRIGSNAVTGLIEKFIRSSGKGIAILIDYRYFFRNTVIPIILFITFFIVIAVPITAGKVSERDGFCGNACDGRRSNVKVKGSNCSVVRNLYGMSANAPGRFEILIHYDLRTVACYFLNFTKRSGKRGAVLIIYRDGIGLGFVVIVIIEISLTIPPTARSFNYGLIGNRNTCNV